MARGVTTAAAAAARQWKRHDGLGYEVSVLYWTPGTAFADMM